MRADFPAAISFFPDVILWGIQDELKKLGRTLEDVRRINIAWPHKDTRKMQSADLATPLAISLQQALRSRCQHIEFPLARGLCETVPLRRTFNQSAVHALTGRQVYEFVPDLQSDTFPFAGADTKREEYFLIVDDYIEQGTTIADLMHFLAANGGIVLAAASSGQPIVQTRVAPDKPIALRPEFTDPAENTGRLAQLSEIASRSSRESGQNFTPDQSLSMLQERLNALDMNLCSLTDGECRRLIETMQGSRHHDKKAFPDLMNDLDDAIRILRAGPAAPRP